MKIELHRRDAYATMLVMIHFDPPPKFRGLDPNLPVRIYHRNLPHWRQDGATYFVTFRLADSLPQSKLEELNEEKARWEKAYPPPRSEEQWKSYAQSVTAKTESWLDEGHGKCILENCDAARILGDALPYFHGKRYDLFASVIMPNH